MYVFQVGVFDFKGLEVSKVVPDQLAEDSVHKHSWAIIDDERAYTSSHGGDWAKEHFKKSIHCEHVTSSPQPYQFNHGLSIRALSQHPK